MIIWFNKKINKTKEYYSRSISIKYYPQHINTLIFKDNGAIKGKDKCYDLNIWFLGLHLSYTNWDYNE